MYYLKLDNTILTLRRTNREGDEPKGVKMRQTKEERKVDCEGKIDSKCLQTKEPMRSARHETCNGVLGVFPLYFCK